MSGSGCQAWFLVLGGLCEPWFLVLSEGGERSLLAGLEYHKVRHRTDRRYQLRQEGVQPKLIETEAMLRQKLEYIHNNPVRRGYVSDPTHWRYSSARNYATIESLTAVTTDW